jgi:hypothetical protein
MFIVTKLGGLLTPSGVKCNHPQPGHGTPDGVRGPRVSLAINMELLAEFLAHNLKCPRSSDKLKFVQPPTGVGGLFILSSGTSPSVFQNQAGWRWIFNAGRCHSEHQPV